MRYDPSNESTDYLKWREAELTKKKAGRLIEGSSLTEEDKEELKAIRLELHRRDTAEISADEMSAA